MKRIVFLCYIAVFLALPMDLISIPRGKDDTFFSQKKKDKVGNKDSDNDGIPDNEDECPNVPGSLLTKGCPDSDADGTPDHLDDCPEISGLVQFRGCPDTDGDGVPDNKDACPNEPGSILNNGCPVSQTVDTVDKVEHRDLNREVNVQIQRFEKYSQEQEYKKQEYMRHLAIKNQMESNHAENVQTEPVDTETVSNENSRNRNDRNKQETHQNNDNNGVTVSNPVAVAANTAAKNTPQSCDAMMLVDKPVVVINNSTKYKAYIPELEALLRDLKFLRGRVVFADNDKSFEALNKISVLCSIHPEWEKITFYCFSNNEIDGINNKAYRSNQLFLNRLSALTGMLIKRLNVPSHRLEFKSVVDFDPKEHNYIKIQIDVASPK